MTSLKTSIKTITYLSDIGCLEIQGASLPGDLESGLKIVTNQLSDVNRKLDYLFDRASDADFGSLRDELKAITETLSGVTFPPAGQMMLHESLAIETLILLRSIAEPGKTKAAKAEVERNGYKVWEPKKER